MLCRLWGDLPNILIKRCVAGLQGIGASSRRRGGRGRVPVATAELAAVAFGSASTVKCQGCSSGAEAQPGGSWKRSSRP